MTEIIETSFQRANRLADEAKARKRAAYDASPQAWRDFDWRDEEESAVYRPVEIATFHGLFAQTFQRNRSFVAALEIVRRADAIDNLRALLEQRQETVLWWDEHMQRLTAYPTTRGRVDAVIVPLHRRKAAA